MSPLAVVSAAVQPSGIHSLSYPPNVVNFLPHIPNFHDGEQRDGETVQNWIEHSESVAGLEGWNDHLKLLHLTSALRGAAKSFTAHAPLLRGVTIISRTEDTVHPSKADSCTNFTLPQSLSGTERDC